MIEPDAKRALARVVSREFDPEIRVGKHHDGERAYPQITPDLPNPKRPISFVCIKYCGDFFHNIILSECVFDELNQFVVVDNVFNVNFVTLGQAMQFGIAQAEHDLMAIVHEDVVLLPGWQSMFEQSLAELEAHDPDWAMVGAIGWKAEGQPHGHFSDPHRYNNTFRQKNFGQVARLDEQLLVLRKSGKLRPDPDLPSIHNVGKDLIAQAEAEGLRCYALNAPTIHKFADEEGNQIVSAIQSEKIRRRGGLQFEADHECCNEYLQGKYDADGVVRIGMPEISPGASALLDSPIILLGRGGSGTRLLTTLAHDLGIFAGSDLNGSGDSREMAKAILRGLFRKFRCPAPWQSQNIARDLRVTAKRMLEQAEWPQPWAFKLPESLFILDELEHAFPNARYVLLQRDPLAMALQRPHLTARPDWLVGQVSLRLAYDALSRPMQSVLEDGDATRMAISTAHQMSLALRFKERIDPARWHDVSFEGLMDQPERQLAALGEFLSCSARTETIMDVVDPSRAEKALKQATAEQIAAVSPFVTQSRRDLGYLKEPDLRSLASTRGT